MFHYFYIPYIKFFDILEQVTVALHRSLHSRARTICARALCGTHSSSREGWDCIQEGCLDTFSHSHATLSGQWSKVVQGRTTYCVFDLPPPALEVACVRDSEHAPTGQKIHTSEQQIGQILSLGPPGQGGFTAKDLIIALILTTDPEVVCADPTIEDGSPEPPPTFLVLDSGNN